MPPPKELNPFSRELSPQESPLGQPRQVLPATPDDDAGMNPRDRITELESRNLYLQSLVVELLDKNEQLRRKIVLQQKGSGLSP